MKMKKIAVLPLLALTVLGGTIANADSVQHRLSGTATTSSYTSTVSDGTDAASYSYKHIEEIKEYGTNQIKFLTAKASNGTSSPSGSQFYNYQIVDVYGGGAGTKTQFLGNKVTSGFSLTTGVTLYSTATKNAYTRALVCADPNGCSGPQANYVYDTWIYSPSPTFRISDQKNKVEAEENSDSLKITKERTPVKKVSMKELKNNVDFTEPSYIPSLLTVGEVELVEPPTSVQGKALRDKLNEWNIKYTSKIDDSFIHLSVTTGGNGILGETEKIKINGQNADIQENEDYITLSWKDGKVTYWMVAHTTDSLTKEEVLKFANSIN